MGATTVRLAKLRATFEPVALPDIRHEPEVVRRPRSRFVQTTGGRTGLPAPRRVKHPPFVQFRAPDGVDDPRPHHPRRRHVAFEVLGASKFPRHWVYDADGKLAAKVGLADFKDWYRDAFGKHTPWGDQDSRGARHRGGDRARTPAVGHDHAGGAKPEIRTVKKGKHLVRAGRARRLDLFLLLDGVLSVSIDGEAVAEVGPGRVLGERAVLEGGLRTASLQAATDVRVAVAPADQVDRDALLATRARDTRRAIDPSVESGAVPGGRDGGTESTHRVGNVAGCASRPGTSTP